MTIPNFVFIITLIGLGIWSTVLSTKGGLTNNRKKKLNKLTRRGRYFAGINILILAVLLFQDFNTRTAADNKQIELKRERNTRDSLITVGIKSGVDSSSNKLFRDISAAFAEQQLKLDTLTNQLSLVKISTPKVINHLGDSPVIHVHNNGISLRNDLGPLRSYNLTIECRDAGATNFKIRTSILTEYENQKYSVTEMNFFPEGFKTYKNSSFSTGWKSLGKGKSKNLYVYFKGTYTSLDGLNTFKIDDLFFYNEKSGKTTLTVGSKRDLILNIISQLRKDGTVTTLSKKT